VRGVAEGQWGVIAWWQLLNCGVSCAAVSRSVAEGWLHRIYPQVYAVGHRQLSIEGRLVAALLYGGKGAVLSHATAAWWWRLTEKEPAQIEISCPRRRRGQPGLRVHHPRTVDATRHRRFPVTTIPRTLLDVAATATLNRVRRLLAEADYHRLLDWDAIEATLGRGHKGSARLRKAIEIHRPELALTRSKLEEAFVGLCEEGKLPMPEINPTVEGEMVDALWRQQRVVVEVDGKAGHATPARMERDRAKDLKLRAAGYVVLRYSYKQVLRQRRLVIPDIQAALAGRG
jgi:predicted transcriptional regulator of viral defense system